MRTAHEALHGRMPTKGIPAGAAVALIVAALGGVLLGRVPAGHGADPLTTVEVAVAGGADDVEEDSGGYVDPSSDDLDLVYDGKAQIVGLRFAGVAVPYGATVESAWVQFASDEITTTATNLSVTGEATGNPLPFLPTPYNVALRLRTSASVPWAPPAWNAVGDAGLGQRTPSLRTVIQEIVNAPLWASRNAVVLFVTGTGRRVAESFEGGRPPRLHIEFRAPRPGPTPTANPSSTPRPPPTITPAPTPTPTPTIPAGRVWRVPEDAPTIQAGVDKAANGDTVLVAPGTYTGNVKLGAKAISLSSHFYQTRDATMIDRTIIDGGITISSSSSRSPTINGFTIQGATDGIKATGPFHIGNCKITKTGDGIDLTSAQGVIIRNNHFEGNSDDAIDFDGSSSGLVEGNMIYANGDDGIEIRLHSYTGPATLAIEIKNNRIEANKEDGIQLIDYDGMSSRTFRIEGNLILSNAMAGLGLMAGGNTKENFSGADIPEPIETYNNTFVNNPYAITGGNNMKVVNNLVVGSKVMGLKNVDASSTVSYNLFWNNAVNHQASNIDAAHTLYADPRLDASYRLNLGSPAINAGTNVGRWYTGPAPDLGAFERA